MENGTHDALILKMAGIIYAAPSRRMTEKQSVDTAKRLFAALHKSRPDLDPDACQPPRR